MDGRVEVILKLNRWKSDGKALPSTMLAFCQTNRLYKYTCKIEQFHYLCLPGTISALERQTLESINAEFMPRYAPNSPRLYVISCQCSSPNKRTISLDVILSFSLVFTFPRLSVQTTFTPHKHVIRNHSNHRQLWRQAAQAGSPGEYTPKWLLLQLSRSNAIVL